MRKSRSSNSAVLLLHPGCPPFAQQVARALYEGGLLSRYATTFSYQSQSVLGKTLKTALGFAMNDAEAQLFRRQITEIPEGYISHHPIAELVRTLAAKTNGGRIAADRIWEAAELWFDRSVARKDLNGEKAVYGYEHAALATFQRQKQRGGICIYDMPIAHHRTASKFLDAEFAAFPETQTPYDAHLKTNAARRNERKDAELQLADFIVCPSEFVKRSLVAAGVPEDRVHVLPFGAPPLVESHRRENRPFVFLSAGSQSVRKGTHHLLDAWRRLQPAGEVELWLIGQMLLPSRLLQGLPGKVVIRDSIPRRELSRIYASASALVLPTVCEGFALTITEAMAHGLPVITTENSGAVGFIESGKNGIIIPAGDGESLAEAMQWCIDNRDEVSQMGKNASATAAGWQWTDYRAEFGKLANGFLRTPLPTSN